MSSLVHTGKVRRKVLILSFFTLLSLAGLLKAISYNNEISASGESALQQRNKVAQNIEGLKASLSEAESAVQSFLLTGDQLTKKNFSASRQQLSDLLTETIALEEDPMQQKKFGLVKTAIEQKFALQQNIIKLDTVSDAYLATLDYHAMNRRLNSRIQVPLSLAGERQQILLQRQSLANDSLATHAKFITIFLAVFVYLLILCALYHLRSQLQPGPTAKMMDDMDLNGNEIPVSGNERFIGVFSIDGKNYPDRRKEGAAIIRALWSKDKKEEYLDYMATSIQEQQKAMEKTAAIATGDAVTEEDLVPEWVAAGLPEELTMHNDRSNDHYLGHAVNASYYQPGPVYNRQPGNYMPAGISSYRVLPAPGHHQPEAPAHTPGQDKPGFELFPLINDVLYPFHVEAAEKNIRLLHTIDPGIPNFLSGDAKKLSDILHGLIENAMRFTYKGYVQLTVTGLNIQSEYAEIAFSIADTGKGIDAEQMHDLLHGPGSQLPALFQAKKLAESQQSQLMIHSTEEDGTVCCFVGKYRV